jgi:hypothetical protein
VPAEAALISHDDKQIQFRMVEYPNSSFWIARESADFCPYALLCSSSVRLCAFFILICFLHNV